MTDEQIARVAHEANRAYCEGVLGDMSHKPWDESAAWVTDSALAGIGHVRSGSTPEQLHDAWCSHKFAEGWRHGLVKDADKKEHPCLVPYAELPEAQRLKDKLYRAVVGALVSA